MLNDQLSEINLQSMFSKVVYQRGLKYYREGRVGDLYYDPERNAWGAMVRGSTPYEVRVEEDDDEIFTECSCPAYEKYWAPCKHIAAVMLKIYDREQSSFSIESSIDRTRLLADLEQEQARQKQQELIKQREKRQEIYAKQLNQFIQAVSTYSEGVGTQQKNLLMVDWFVSVKNPSYSSPKFLYIEMKVGQKRTYVVKNIKGFLRAISQKARYPFTKTFTYDSTEQQFSQEDQEVITLLQEALKSEELYRQFQASYFRSSGGTDDRAIMIPPMLGDELLKKLNHGSVHFECNGQIFKQLQIHSTELPFSIQLDKGEENGFQMNVKELMAYDYLDMYGYLLQGNQFYKIASDEQVVMKELKELADKSTNAVLPIANDQIEPFLSHVVPAIERISKLEITDEVSSQIVKAPLEARLYVDLFDEYLQASLKFSYGEHQFNPLKQVAKSKSGPIIMREEEREKAIIEIVDSAFRKCDEKGLSIKEEEGIYEFIYETLPRLEENVDIYLTNAVKSLVLPERHAPVTKIDVHSSGDWLEIGFDMAGIDQEEIHRILQSAVEKKKYYRLPNGAFISLETAEFQAIQNMAEEFNLKPQQFQQESIHLPIYRGFQLDEILHKNQGSKAKYGKQFRQLLKRLKNPEELEFDIPDTLQAELRDYQNDGFQWLKTLRLYHLGGILADDMGLGKTLQSITFILSLFSENKDSKPALIVAPASLIYNWKNEFQRFAPSLTVEVMSGTPQEREEKLQGGQLPNVWITSYPTLRQDIEYYNQRQFSTLILDEAQAIKNYATKTAKAVRQIQAGTCIALSGTPIENSIDELWSIFQTVLPDFFPNQSKFRQLDPEKVAMMVQPFLLRRLKKDVLTELPDKIETAHYSELTKQQKNHYVAYLEKIQSETKESLQRDGFQKSQIKILAGLTRLRQLCCHPSLFLENYTGDSGKLEQLMEIVVTAKENGRRMLIFSQFTSMLSIIRERLMKAEIDFFYLDGQTKPKERVQMVEEFNQGNGDVFLISLKAGNTGLNLTGADTVILYDLWWNPAVEEQAAGRAHRIGQKNVVQVIRLITQGTIEEKIYQLQQSKKELIDTIVQPGDQALSKITEQEIRELLNI